MASKNGRTPESYEPGDLNFHYNREEREAMLSEDTRRVLRKTKFFSMNRRNMIILADIAVIVLFTMIFAPIAMGGRSTARMDGFRASLKAYEYDGSVLISLKIEAREDNPQEAGLVTAKISIEGTDMSEEVVDLLPSAVDTPRHLRVEFPSENDEKKKALVDMEINGVKRTLSAGVKSE
ncbi:MAG: hypothetical protein PQJ61_17725 [Spirochaetales bacterium]|uniref:Uncharacterized protein n=1 Tax=Candidatus Thalassospirochaeta sargassi TaxID=3119039 RepID=A0AAJ1ILZ1_9SPIO|nr:hypothetical protein [Spirochaetales bacterium]